MTGIARFHRRRPPPSRAWLALAVVVALIVGQALGLLHRTIHADPGGSPAMSIAAADDDRGWIEALFAGHRGQRDCDAFDQLGHADLAVDASVRPALAMPRPAAPPPTNGVGHIVAQALAFLARGPPVLA